MAAGYISHMELLSPNISISAPESQLKVTYDTGTNWSWQFILVDNITGKEEASGYLSRTRSAKDTVIEKIVLESQPGVTITPGCKRLYYDGAIVNFNDPNYRGTGQTKDYKLDVLFKGHFDVWAQ